MAAELCPPHPPAPAACAATAGVLRLLDPVGPQRLRHDPVLISSRLSCWMVTAQPTEPHPSAGREAAAPGCPRHLTLSFLTAHVPLLHPDGTPKCRGSACEPRGLSAHFLSGCWAAEVRAAAGVRLGPGTRLALAPAALVCLHLWALPFTFPGKGGGTLAIPWSAGRTATQQLGGRTRPELHSDLARSVASMSLGLRPPGHLGPCRGDRVRGPCRMTG